MSVVINNLKMKKMSHVGFVFMVDYTDGNEKCIPSSLMSVVQKIQQELLLLFIRMDLIVLIAGISLSKSYTKNSFYTCIKFVFEKRVKTENIDYILYVQWIKKYNLI